MKQLEKRLRALEEAIKPPPKIDPPPDVDEENYHRWLNASLADKIRLLRGEVSVTEVSPLSVFSEQEIADFEAYQAYERHRLGLDKLSNEELDAKIESAIARLKTEKGL